MKYDVYKYLKDVIKIIGNQTTQMNLKHAELLSKSTPFIQDIFVKTPTQPQLNST